MHTPTYRRRTVNRKSKIQQYQSDDQEMMKVRKGHLKIYRYKKQVKPYPPWVKPMKEKGCENRKNLAECRLDISTIQ